MKRKLGSGWGGFEESGRESMETVPFFNSDKSKETIMIYADITGWGKCAPPAILTNADLSTFLDTDDAWIVSRTGMKERRISHVPVSDLAHVACA